MRAGQNSLNQYMELRKRENNLDLVRFIVACLVMYFHAYHLTGSVHSQELLRVMIFFMISGFFVFSSFSKNKDVKQFILARAARILPGLLVVVLITIFFIGPWMTSLTLTEYIHSVETWKYLQTIMIYTLPSGLPGVFESNLYSTEVNGSLWTLQLEVVYYTSIIILFFINGLNRVHLLVLFLIMNVVHFLSLPFGTTYIELYRFFLIGMLYYAWRSIIPIRHLYALVSIVVLWAFKDSLIFNEMFMFFGSYLVLYVVYKWMFTIPLQRTLGNLSYGMFLYGYPIQQVVAHYSPSATAFFNFLYALPFTLLCASLSWRFIESPSLQWSKRRISQMKEQQVQREQSERPTTTRPSV